MGLYATQVFPRLMNVIMDTKQTRVARERVCAGLSGEVVEIGFGTGHNLPFLPPGVTRLRAVDPSAVGTRLARERIAASPVPVELAGLDGQDLPFEDGSADAVLCTWTLCSIPDPVRAVREVRRVLRPGGALHFVEHGRAPDPEVRRWQDRFTPLQKRMGVGCHLNRDIPAILEAGGLRLERLDAYYTPGEPRVVGSAFEGLAVPS
jgi:ubiquinone/menaquinone biosynthesis C-methylase UbiE